MIIVNSLTNIKSRWWWWWRREEKVNKRVAKKFSHEKNYIMQPSSHQLVKRSYWNCMVWLVVFFKCCCCRSHAEKKLRKTQIFYFYFYSLNQCFSNFFPGDTQNFFCDMLRVSRQLRDIFYLKLVSLVLWHILNVSRQA
jgi:hypothetical protein